MTLYSDNGMAFVYATELDACRDEKNQIAEKSRAEILKLEKKEMHYEAELKKLRIA